MVPKCSNLSEDCGSQILWKPVDWFIAPRQIRRKSETLLVWCAAGPPIQYPFDALCNHSSTSPKLSSSLQTVLLSPSRPARLPNLTNMQTIELCDALGICPLISGIYGTIIGVPIIIRSGALTWFSLFPPSKLRCCTSYAPWPLLIL